MTAVLKRELRAYFLSPLGYVFVGIFYFFSGYFFFANNLYGGVTDMTAVFERLFPIVLFMSPVLTMRLISEERRQKTEQVLFSAPISAADIVLGKYGAALIVYCLAISGLLLEAVVMSFFGQPDWPVILGNFTGLVLLGAALIALCLFFSSLTESQFIAVIIGFASNLILILLDAIRHVVRYAPLKALLREISLNRRYQPFTEGILDIPSGVLFLSIAVLFLSVTVSALDKRRCG